MPLFDDTMETHGIDGTGYGFSAKRIDTLGAYEYTLVGIAADRSGSVHRFDASKEAIPGRELRSSTHALGISETLELARALGRLPERTVVFGVEGLDFTAHEGLTVAVADGVARAATAVLEEVAQCTSAP